jgi:glutathione S-transferase
MMVSALDAAVQIEVNQLSSWADNNLQSEVHLRAVSRQPVREWSYRDVDVLLSPVYGCYSVWLTQRKPLPINIEPAVADYHRQRAERTFAKLDSRLAGNTYLCAAELTIADFFCYGDVAFAERSARSV